MNPVIGFQITAQDFAGLNEFYAQSFGWDITPGPHENVTAIAAGPADAGDFEGSTIARGEHIPDYVSLCIGTHDIEATVARTLAHGATLIRPPFELPQGDVLAIVSDPEGHVLTLVQKLLKNNCDTSNQRLGFARCRAGGYWPKCALRHQVRALLLAEGSVLG